MSISNFFATVQRWFGYAQAAEPAFVAFGGAVLSGVNQVAAANKGNATIQSIAVKVNAGAAITATDLAILNAYAPTVAALVKGVAGAVQG